RDHAVYASDRTLLRRLSIASVVNRNHRVGCAHREHRMVTVRDLALEQHLLEITQCGRHTLHALPKLDEMIPDELLGETALEQPGKEMPHIPPIESDLRTAVVPE